MTTTNNMNTNFNFRTKFKKLLNDDNYSKVETGFNNFCSLESEKALDILWHFTYISDVYLIGVSNLGMPTELLFEENLSLTRNELRHQYEKKINCNFLSVDIPEECEEAFEELVKKTDTITAKVIFERCKPYFHMREADMSRILYLLKSDKENLCFGGIRNFDFDMDEADYLKPYHMEIHNMLEKIYNFLNKEEYELPFYMDEDEKEKEVEEEVSKEYKPITPEEILLHKDVFKSFVEKEDLNLLIPIGEIGFDLNEVMSKKDKIFEFIIVAEDLI